ncbi:MAG: response regulator [Verrucomicrobiae bacterium]|nr:response regulator [Verrucomicrobiae bacterium]
MLFLCVNDDVVLEHCLAKHFHQSGHQLIGATTANEVFASLGTLAVHAVFANLRLLRQKPLTLIEKLRAYRENLPVIAMANTEDFQLLAAAMERGATDFMLLPVTRERLAQVIDGVVQLAASGRHFPLPETSRPDSSL